MLTYDKDKIKNSLSMQEVFDLVEYLQGEPSFVNDNAFIANTICHNGDSHKLYYYNNTQLFQCYTQCGSFDIFELVVKVKECNLPQAIKFVASYFNISGDILDDDGNKLEDWDIFAKKEKEISIDNEEMILQEYDRSILENYPAPNIINWELEGIKKEVCDYMDIKYNPSSGGVLIPHYDEYDRLVGIRERTLVKDFEKYGKYHPARINTILYNHPLAFNLYGLNKAKENIKLSNVAIVVESEKSVLQYMSYFGIENNLCVAVCGSNLSRYQLNLLIDNGAKEVCIGFDKDFEELGDNNYKQVVEKLQKIYDKYSSYVNMSFLFDKEGNKLSYKNSPLDCGKDKFLYLWKNRIVI